MFEAKVVMITRPGASATILSTVSCTTRSEGVRPATSMRVVSERSTSTPSSPSWRRRRSSVRGPEIGVGSNLKSPVAISLPPGVCSTTAMLPGMLWLTGTNSASTNCPSG